MTAERVELVNKGHMLRRDQADRIAALTAARPGASYSDIVRDVLDLGFPEYERRQALMRTLAERVG